MNKELKGKRTEADVMAAYAAECMSAVKYGMYAKLAAEEGFPAIAEWFTVLSENERTHAETWFRLLTGGRRDTETNIRDTLKGEMYECGEMYRTFAEVAEGEQLHVIAALFRAIGRIEERHKDECTAILDAFNAHVLSERASSEPWTCYDCGHRENSEYLPDGCPVCGAGAERLAFVRAIPEKQNKE